MAAPLACVYVYQGPKFYLSVRDAGGNWSAGSVFGDYDSTDTYNGVSTGYPGDSYPDRLGVIQTPPTLADPALWLGNGPPDAALPILLSNDIVGDEGPRFWGYWDCSMGGWWANSAWYALLVIKNPTGGYYRFAMLKSIAYEGEDPDRPNLWTEMDQTNSPVHTAASITWLNAAARWDGISSKIDLISVSQDDTSIYSLWTYDLATDTWSAAYGTEEFGTPQIFLPYNGSVGNGIFRFPNDDIGVVYCKTTTVYYRLYVAATSSWSAEVVVKTYAGGDARVGTIIPDSSKESLHVFTIDNNNPSTTAAYHVVPHTDAPIPDCYSWGTLDTPDAFGNGTIFEGQLCVPFDSNDDNLVWIAPNTGGATTFVSETLPRPVGDTGLPSCASLFYIPTVTQDLAGTSAGTSTASGTLTAGGQTAEGPGVNNVMLVITV